MADRQVLKGKFVKNFDYTQAFSYSEIIIMSMASADDKCDVSTLSGSFDLNAVTVYNREHWPPYFE